MNFIEKYKKFKYKYIITMTLIFFILIFVLFFLDSNLSLGALFGSYPDEFQSFKAYVESLLSYEIFLLSIGRFQFILPILAVCSTLDFKERVNNFFFHSFTRKGKYNETIIKELLLNTIIIALFFFSAYLIVDCIAYLLLPLAGGSQFPSDYLLADIFGSSFYTDHLFIFSIASGFIKIFVPVFVYSLFALLLTLKTKKTWMILCIPVLYHFALIVIIPLISFLFNYNTYILYFSPSFLMQPSGFSQPITYMIFIGYIPYILIFGCMFKKILHSKERMI